MPPQRQVARAAPVNAPARTPATQTSTSVDPARVAGPPAVRLAPPGTASPGVVDISQGQFSVPEAEAEAIQPHRNVDVPVRMPGLAEGTVRVRKSGSTSTFSSPNPTAIALVHPALAPYAEQLPTVLVVSVRENVVTGWVGLGQPGPVRGSRRSLVDAMVAAANALGCAGMTRITVPRVTNEFAGGRINVAVDNMGFRLGGYLEGTGAIRLDNRVLSIEGGARIDIPNGSGGELRVRRGSDGQLGGSLRIAVSVGPVSGTVIAALEQGFVHVQGTVAYRSPRMSGSLTLISTDARTARDLTTRTDLDPSQPAVQQPSEEHPARPGPRAFCGWGELEINLTPWLSGRARVIVNDQGQATILGEIRPQRELILFAEREWNRRLFRVEIRAGYGIPVIAQVYVFAAIGLEAIARVGPGRIHNMSVSGQFSTDPRVENLFTITGSLNISAFAGLRLRAEGGVGISILGHDIRAGVALTALAGIRGYVDATPSIGRRHREGGRPEWFIHGHLEIAAQPFLGFGGELFVELDSPWWSPAPDKRWTWPLFNLEYPLPGEFGIGADVDYVLGSRSWPTIQFGEVDFDSSKFMTDMLNDNVPRGSGGERRRPGSWREGAGGAPGGARNPGGRGRGGAEGDTFNEPVGETIPISAGGESHRLWFAERGPDVTLMAASEPGPVDRLIAECERRIPELRTPAEQAEVRRLAADARRQLPTLDSEGDRIAAMKVAGRQAAESYRRHGRGRREARGNKPNPRTLNNALKPKQRRLAGVLTRLITMTARQQFRPIVRRAAARTFGEPVGIWALRGRAFVGVSQGVGGAGKGLRELSRLLTGPVSRAINRSAYTLIADMLRSLRTVDEAVWPVVVTNNLVNRAAYTWLLRQADTLSAPVARVGDRMRIANLERSRRVDPLQPQETISFPPFPPDKVPRYRRYRDAFVAEMRRQLALQEAGANRLTVDRWFANLTLFRMHPRAFAQFDRPGREHIRNELQARARRALDRADGTIQRKDREIAELMAREDSVPADREAAELARYRAGQRREAVQAIIAELLRAQAAERAADATADSIRPNAETLRPRYPDRLVWSQFRGEWVHPEMAVGVLGRQGAERPFGDRLRRTRVIRRGEPARTRSILQRLFETVPEWVSLVRSARGPRGLAILHNPDQVFGGPDFFPDIPPEPAADDVAGWQRYKEFLLRYVGSAEVNSRIGKLWNDRVAAAYSRVRLLVQTQEAMPINRLNFRLIVAP